MIKNCRAARLAILSLALIACDGTRSSVPSPHQGVIELDQRVLAFEVGGRIVSVDVARGEAVRAGQRIAALDDALVRPMRAARVAEIDAARAQLALLEGGARPQEIAALEAQVRALMASEQTIATVLTRQKLLVADRTAPEATLDEPEGRLRTARAQRQAAEHQLASLRAGARGAEIDAARAHIAALEAALEAEDLRQDKLALHAPADGVIFEVLADPGEVALPGAPIVTLGDRDHPYVDIFVATAALAPLDVGQRAEVLVDGLPPLTARIERIGDTTEFTPRFVFSKEERQHLVVRVRLRISDPEHRVHPGLPAFAIFPAAPAGPPAPPAADTP